MGYGISINTTTPGGWSLGAEYSFREDVPLQWNAFELIYAGLQLPTNPNDPNSTPVSLLQQQRQKELGADFDINGLRASGYDRYNVSQFQKSNEGTTIKPKRPKKSTGTNYNKKG